MSGWGQSGQVMNDRLRIAHWLYLYIEIISKFWFTTDPLSRDLVESCFCEEWKISSVVWQKCQWIRVCCSSCDVTCSIKCLALRVSFEFAWRYKRNVFQLKTKSVWILNYAWSVRGNIHRIVSTWCIIMDVTQLSFEWCFLYGTPRTRRILVGLLTIMNIHSL